MLLAVAVPVEPGRVLGAVAAARRLRLPGRERERGRVARVRGALAAVREQPGRVPAAARPRAAAPGRVRALAGAGGRGGRRERGGRRGGRGQHALPGRVAGGRGAALVHAVARAHALQPPLVAGAGAAHARLHGFTSLRHASEIYCHIV